MASLLSPFLSSEKTFFGLQLTGTGLSAVRHILIRKHSVIAVQETPIVTTLFRFIVRAVLIILLIAAGMAEAAENDVPLTAAITTLLNNTIHLPPSVKPVLTVKIVTSPAQLTRLCDRPVLSLSGDLSRLAGMHSIIAQCDRRRQFIQVHVDAIGTWWQASRLLRPGEPLRKEDIHPQRGSLEHMPGGLIFDAQQIVGREALRIIHPGENLVESQLRQRRAIRASEKVDITLQGNAFIIRATGKALDNAALKQPLRVQMATGQILPAIATGEGQVLITAN